MSFAYMPFFTGDYYRDTRHLSMLQHGAYRQLLDHCWDQRGPLPLDIERCYRICCAVSKEEQEAVRGIVSEFFILLDDGHYNKRIQQEIERANVLSGKRSGAARERWKARDSLVDIAAHNASAMQVHSKSIACAPSPSPSPSPTSEDQEISPHEYMEARSRPLDDRPEDAATESKKPKNPVLNCPHLQILALWAEVLPALPQHDPAHWHGTRRAHLQTRWRDTCVAKKWQVPEQGINYFRKFFEYVGASRFLTGQVHPRDGAKSFVCELEWLILPSNWAKAHEGKYHQQRETTK